MATLVQEQRPKILDHVAVEVLQVLQDSFAVVTNVSVTIMDLEGNFVTRPSNTLALCMKGIRADEQGHLRCRGSDIYGRERSLETQGPAIYTCGCGLTDFAAPIILNDKCLAVVYGGQVIVDEQQKPQVMQVVKSLGLSGEEWASYVRNLRRLSEDDVQTAAEVMFALFNVAVEMGQCEQLQFTHDNLLELLNRVARRLTRADESCVLRLDEEAQELEVVAGCERSRESGLGRASAKGGVLNQVLEKGRPVLIPDIQKHGDGTQWVGHEQVKAEIVLPLRVGGEIRGLLNLNFFEPQQFTEDISKTAGLLARQIALMMEGAGAIGAIGDKVRNQSILNKVVAALRVDEPLPDVLGRIAQHASEMVPESSCAIWLHDKRFGKVELVTRAPKGPVGGTPREDVSVDDTIIGKFLDSGAPQVLHNVPGEEGFRSDKVLNEGSPASLAWIPLKRNGEIQGFLLLSCQQRHYFTADDIDFLSILAEHVVAAITNQQLQQTEKALVELATLRSQARSVPEFLQSVIGQFLPKNFSCCATSVFFINEAKDKLVLWASTGIRGEPRDEDLWYGKGEGMTGWVWQHGQSLRVPDDAQLTKDAMEKFSPPPEPRLKNCESIPPDIRPQLLAVPILRGEEITGVLRMCGRADDRRFTELDERLARGIGEQLGHDIHNLQALDSRQRRLDTLGHVVEVIQFEAEEKNILYLVLSGITCGRGLGFNRAGAWLLDENQEWLEPCVVIGATSAEEARRMWEENGILTFADMVRRFKARGIKVDQSLQDRFDALRIPFRKGSDCVVTRCCQHRETQQCRSGELASASADGGNRPLFEAFGDHLFVLVPIEVGDECVGVIYADNAFDRKPIQDDDVSLLETFARHAGLAIWRVRTNRQHRLRAELDQKITHEIVQDPESDDVLDRILGHMEKAFGFAKYLLYFHDLDRDVVSVLGSQGFDEELAKQISYRATATEGAIATRVIKSRQRYFTPSAETDTVINQYWQQQLNIRGPVLGLPLQVGDTVCGALIINDERVTENDEQRLKPCVNELAVAVRLADQTRKRRAAKQTIELMSEVNSSFARALEDKPGFLSRLAEQIARILDAKLCAIYWPFGAKELLGDTANEFERLGAYNYPASAREDVRVARTGAFAGVTNHVLAGEIVNVPDVTKDRRWMGKQNLELEGVINAPLRAFLGVPMKDPASQKVIGAITLTRERRSVEFDGRHFDERDIALVQAIATAVASLLATLDRKRLVESQKREVERHHAELDALFRVVADKLPEEVSFVDPDFTIRYVNRAKLEKFSDEVEKYGGKLEGQKCYEVYEKRARVCPACPIQTAMEKARSGDRAPVQDKSHFGRPFRKPPYSVSVIASAVVDEDTKDVLGGVEVATDETEAARKMDERVGQGAHELVNRMSAIRTWVRNIKKRITDMCMDDGHGLRQAIGGLEREIHDIREFATALMNSTKLVRLKTAPCDLHELVEECLKGSGVPHLVESLPDGRRWRMTCDRAKLAGVFEELLTNAKREATDTGTALRVFVRLEPWMEGATETGLSVLFADNGRGISEEDRGHVFERLRSGFEEGHGIGLCIVERTLKAHEGAISLCRPEEVSELQNVFPEGPGAVFRIFLPHGLESNVL